MINPNNYRLVELYLQSLRDGAQIGEKSLNRYSSDLNHFLIYADDTPFNDIGSLWTSFPQHLASLPGTRGAPHLAACTLKKVVETTQRFLFWGMDEFPRAFKSVKRSWVKALRPPRMPQTPHLHDYASLEYVRSLVATPYTANELALWRDQSMIALAFLSGMRAGALGSLPLRAVDIEGRRIRQFPELGVRTKGAKHATTTLLNIPDLLDVVKKWDSYVRERLPDTAMWFTPIIVHFQHQALSDQPAGVYRNCAVASRTRTLCEAVGAPYRHPHLFRRGHAVIGLKSCRTMADYKAVSMNLMHEDLVITDKIYARLLSDEVHERVSALTIGQEPGLNPSGELADYLRQQAQTEDIAGALHAMADIISSRLRSS